MKRSVLFAAFVGTVWAANYAITHWGSVPVGFGLKAPAGVYFAGLGFVLRDALHEAAGRTWVVAAILSGAVLSWLLGAGGTIPGGVVSIAVASGAAFLLSEFADFAVYVPVREKTTAGAIALSQVVGAAVDSALFLWLAFGSLTFFTGQFVGKTEMVLPGLAMLIAYRASHSRRSRQATSRSFLGE